MKRNDIYRQNQTSSNKRFKISFDDFEVASKNNHIIDLSTSSDDELVSEQKPCNNELDISSSKNVANQSHYVDNDHSDRTIKKDDKQSLLHYVAKILHSKLGIITLDKSNRMVTYFNEY